ncbi:MAG: hypothetical protein AAB570_00215 [Patescibacteria group bacterium]
MIINDIILSASIGALLALVLAVPAIVGELRRTHKGHFLLPDVHHGWGRRTLKDREVFALGLLMHIVTGIAFGVLYPVTVIVDAIPELLPYTWGSVAVYGSIFYVVLGAVVMPLGHMGVFGRKEDRWIWLETLVTLTVFTVGYVLIVGWFQPAWFDLVNL